MKTIYFYGIANNIGGMECYALQLIKNVLEKTSDYKFHIITEYEDFAFKNEFSKLNCDISIVPNSKKHPIRFKKKFLEILSFRKDGDFLQLNLMSYRNVFLLYAVKKASIKTIVVGHSINTKNKLGKLEHVLFRSFYKKIGDKRIGANKNVTKYMFGNNETKCEIIPIGIEPEQFAFDFEKRQEIRKQLNINDNDFALGNVGRISKEKNQLFLCKVMKKLKNYPEFRLFLYGKDNFPKVSKYIKKHKLCNVKLMGEVKNTTEVYNSFDLFLFPSLFESSGLALYEALANGCTSLISNRIPLDGIESKHLFAEKLNVDKWVNFILNLKNHEINHTQKNILPTVENEIDKYLNLYKEI